MTYDLIKTCKTVCLLKGQTVICCRGGCLTKDKSHAILLT